MTGADAHLTADQVARIVQIVQDTDAVIIGGQSVNLWAEHYARRDKSLAEQGPFTSKDLDFYGDRKAAEKIADSLGGVLYIPKLEDHTPNSAKVVGVLDDREIEIDFMRAVLGVEDASIRNNFITLRGRHAGGELRLMLLHPLDCLRSRFANINILGREDELSIKQASVALHVLRCFIDELLSTGQWKHAQTILHDLFYVVRDEFVRGRNTAKYDDLNPLPVMKVFLEHPTLDQRWRSYNLGSMVTRLESLIGRITTS